MRTAISLFVLVSLFSSCTNQTEETPVVVKGKTLIALPVSPDKVKGTYVGDFKGTPISITLNYVSNNHASGYNVHKGLTRNIAGSIEFANGKLHLQLAEPGNNPFDGEFDLEIDTAKWSGKGHWKPLKKGQETSFTFKKQATPGEEEQYGKTYLDSLENSIMLKPDGSCTYTFLTDSTNTGQETTIRGNYQKDKNAVTIYWQKNTVFPSGKSVFKIVKQKPYEGDDYTTETLKGEGKVFNEINY